MTERTLGTIAGRPDQLLPTEWWRHGLIYQVYLQSFADSDGDGVGDIEGLRQRLPYLAELGVDAIWISPWYPSPLRDGGYDVADYVDIDPRYGTLDGAARLIDEAHRSGIGVVVDMVPNHTSTEHRWFRQAVASEPGSAERDRYLIRPGRGQHGELPPSDWRSVFGGSAWSRLADGQWYLHLFHSTQADLNWNNPSVVEAFDDILRFWLELGVDGFRIDVAHGMIKQAPTEDLGPDSIFHLPAHQIPEPVDHPIWDRDPVHDIVRRWRHLADRYQNRLLVAEAWIHPDRRVLYLRDDEYHQVFNFDLLEAGWDTSTFRRIISESVSALESVRAQPTWVLSSHDVMRPATRYGLPAGTDCYRWSVAGPHEALDPERGLRRARAAGLITLALPGSAYVYQGEELGLPEIWDLPPEVLKDPTWEQSGHEIKGRDGCRVPIPWEPSGPSLGFGPGDPWLPQPPEFKALAVSVQERDPGSTLNLYRTAIRLRAENLAHDRFRFVDSDPAVLAFERGDGWVCMANMGEEPVDLITGEVVLSSSPIADSILPPDTTVWMIRR